MNLKKLQWVLLTSVVSLLAVGLALSDQKRDRGDEYDEGDKYKGKFIEKSDDGEEFSVLPSPDTLAGVRDPKNMFAKPNSSASVFAASYGSGNVTYHGGRVMSNPNYFTVYYNTAVANSTATSLGYSNIQNQISSFVNTFLVGNSYTGSATDDYAIVGQYTDSGARRPVPAGVPGLKGSFVDTKSTPSSITDSSIRSYLASLLNAGKIPRSTNTIYGVYFPPGTSIALSSTSKSCTAFCGYHSSFSNGGITIKYAVYPYPNCSGCKISSLTVADMLTIISSHEIREAVTDPMEAGYGWYDATGYEADDKCAWHNLYQMKRPAGLNFWVQPEYSNGGGIYPGPGCVKP